MDEPLLFAGSSHPTLAAAIASCAQIKMGSLSFCPFPDHEICLQINDHVRGREVFVVQTIAHRPNDYLMELFLLIDALKRASAKRIIAVLPYFGYARQDRQIQPRQPISAKLVADLLTTAGANHLLTMDLHAPQIQGFFDIPVDHVPGSGSLIEAIGRSELKNFVIMAPDLGAIKIAHAYAKELGAEFAVMDKSRLSPQQVEIHAVIGPVKGRKVLIVDDLCSTGQTLVQAARAAKAAGATTIFAACSHALLAGNAQEILEKSCIEKIFFTNSIPVQKGRFEVVSIAPLFGKAIQCICLGESLSSIFH